MLSQPGLTRRSLDSRAKNARKSMFAATAVLTPLAWPEGCRRRSPANDRDHTASDQDAAHRQNTGADRGQSTTTLRSGKDDRRDECCTISLINETACCQNRFRGVGGVEPRARSQSLGRVPKPAAVDPPSAYRPPGGREVYVPAVIPPCVRQSNRQDLANAGTRP